MLTKTITLKLLLSLVFILCSVKTYSQDKFEISGGAGIPDLLNIKVKYGMNFQIGASVGFFLSNPQFTGQYYYHYRYMIYSIDTYYHFGGKSRHIIQHPWYIKNGLGYCKIKDITDYPNSQWANDERDIFIYSRIGRKINFSNKIGITADIGPALGFIKIISHDNRNLKDDIIVIPSYNIGFFVRL